MTTTRTQRVLMLLAAAVCADAAAVEYQPFDGLEGYQDIRVSDDTYYVGFHGKRDAQFQDVVQGWYARSAELCSAAGATHFTELAHVLEPITAAEREKFIAGDAAGRLVPAAARTVFIPIIVPRSSGNPYVYAPSKLAAMRCVSDPSAVLDTGRLMAVGETLEAARRANFGVRGSAR